jgi:crotonobetainyl-CoA:carnitine CoA-transferase CaiB-like acyl-CoA transferase
MGKPELADDARFADMYNRWCNQEVLDEIIGTWTSQLEDYGVMETLQKVGVAAAPSLSSERLYADPHLQEREVLRAVKHPVMGESWVVAPPWRLSETPAAIKRHSPLLGEHNEEVLNGLLGIPKEEIEKLEADEVVY